MNDKYNMLLDAFKYAYHLAEEDIERGFRFPIYEGSDYLHGEFSAYCDEHGIEI